jgi:hypothetical protein
MMAAPDWEWTDNFGDTLEVYRAGSDVVLAIRYGHLPPTDSNQLAVTLDPEQIRGLRAALGAHVRSLT